MSKLKKLQGGGPFRGFSEEDKKKLKDSADRSRTSTGLKSQDKAQLTEKQMLEKKAAQAIADKQEIARRKATIAKSNSSTTFKEQMKNSAVGEKLRLFPNDPDSFVDNYINPAKWIGDMADDLSKTVANPKSGIGDYARAIGTPLAAGALAGIGTKTKLQFANNVLNPVGSFNPFKKKTLVNNPEIDRAKVIMDNLFDEEETLLNSAEGQRRLKALGTDKADKRFKKIKEGIDYNNLNYSLGEYGTAAGSYDQMRDYINIDLKNIAGHDEKSLRQLGVHELGHAMQRQKKSSLFSRPFFEETNIDKELRNLQRKEAVSPSADKAEKYFRRDAEPLPFAREFRENMRSRGIINHPYQEITDNHIKEGLTTRSGSTEPTGFADMFENSPENRKILQSIYKRLPVVAGLTAGTIAMDKKKKGGSVSKMGYRDDSPYRDRKQITINTPDGLIDMSETGIPIMANGRYLPPYSGMHQFDTDRVVEKPVGNIYQEGGYTNEDLYNFLFEEDQDENAPVTAPVAPPVQEAPPEDDGRNMEAMLDMQRRYQMAMDISQEENKSRYRRSFSAVPDIERGEGAVQTVADENIRSSGQYGAKNIGQYGRQIYSELSQDLGYNPVANSIYRDPKQQEALVKQGVGAKNSYHTTGNAVDIKPADWAKLSSEAKAKYKSKYDVLYHNNHYHLEPK